MSGMSDVIQLALGCLTVVVCVSLLFEMWMKAKP